MAYNASNISVLEGLDPVRKRPGMYVGSTSVKGLNHLVYEILDNSVDEHLAGYCNNITVALNKDGSATVDDDGRGIPVDPHEKGYPAERIIMTTLHAGGKFDNTNYKTAGGLHGVGSSVVNALSNKMTVDVSRDGQIWHDEYAKGVPTLKLKKGELLPATGKARKTGTKITFWPDDTIFDTVKFKAESICERLRETAFLNPDLTITFFNLRDDKEPEVFHEPNGIAGFVDSLVADDQKAKRVTETVIVAGEKEGIKITAAFCYTYAKHIARSLHMSDKQYRTILSELRGHIDVLERRLCTENYSFKYENQPSKALFKYRKAFIRNDGARYEQFLTAVREGRLKMNATSVYPFEIIEQCIRPKQLTERHALDVTWDSLPDYTDNRNAIAFVDGSGSMYSSIGEVSGGGSYSPISVAVSLGMYFAERNKGAFHNRFITFSERPQLVEIKGTDIYEKTRNCMAYNEVANTDLYEAFMLLLITAVKNNIPQEELPETIYIISDMEFDRGVNRDRTVFEDAKEKYEDYGYHLPNVVYWSVDSRHQQFPVDMNEKGVALVSGCSPTIFKMAMSQNVTPESFMLEILNGERYRRIFA